MTEPRRIAAVSSAERIRYEMNVVEPIVAHHIRYETKVTKDTQIAVMTDGVLLNQMSTDFLLEKYSVIILDEAHER
jgi:ATP-dependent RNA helicase DHX37/DHR1